MPNLTDANTYFLTRLFSDEWDAANDVTKQKALNTAENLINSQFVLRDTAATSTNYINACYEQALHLLKFDQERYQLQQEGVSQYRVDDVSFQMKNNLIAPNVCGMLKTLIYNKVGDIV